MRALLLFSLLVCSTVSWATQQFRVVPGGVYSVDVSREDPNTLMITGGSKLKGVWGSDTAVTINKKEDINAALFQPLLLKQFSLMVADSNGHTFTILANPRDDLPGQSIVLVSNPVKSDRLKNNSSVPSDYVSNIASIFKNLYSGATPTGYTYKSINKTIPLWQETRITHAGTYVGSDWVVEKLLITNTSKDIVRIVEPEFSGVFNDIAAVSLERKNLESGESSAAFIVRGAF